MFSNLWLFCAALSSILGLMSLALSLPSHWQQIFGSSPQWPRHGNAWRSLGAALLIMGAGFCILADRPSIAVLVWLMLVASGSLSVALLLTYGSAWLRPRRFLLCHNHLAKKWLSKKVFGVEKH